MPTNSDTKVKKKKWDMEELALPKFHLLLNVLCLDCKNKWQKLREVGENPMKIKCPACSGKNSFSAWIPS